MSKQQHLLDQILPILYSVKEDEEKLQKILMFLIDEIYEEFDESYEIPEKYKEVVKNIAACIDNGFVCFLNPDTLEFSEKPLDEDIDPEEFERTTGEKYEDHFPDAVWEKCIEFKPLESKESFSIMEQFVDEIEDKKLQNKLLFALEHKKPFAHFKQIVENSTYHDYWYKFKQHKLEDWVWETLSFEFEEINFDIQNDINGLYNDDGSKIDPESVPVPGLCIVCKKYQIDDWDENVFCLLNRNDQKDSDNFECGAFEKIN